MVNTNTLKIYHHNHFKVDSSVALNTLVTCYYHNLYSLEAMTPHSPLLLPHGHHHSTFSLSDFNNCKYLACIILLLFLGC